jgi:hypothetical protein
MAERFLTKFYIFLAILAGLFFGSHYFLLELGETKDPTDAARG